MQRIFRGPRIDRRWLVALLLVALLMPVVAVQVVRAATIGVNGATGTDSAACGTGGTPCKTVGYAVKTRANNGDTITVAAGTYTESITVAKSMTITGAGQNATKLDGGNASQVLHVNTGVNLTLRGVTVQNGNATPGGGIYNTGTLALADAVVSANSAATAGGGIFNDGPGTLNLKNVTVGGNKAQSGAGIFNNGTAVIEGSTIANNTASETGGGLNNATTTGKVTLTTSTVSGNSAKFGGGIGNGTSGTVTADRSTISGNTVTDIGGGIYNRGGAVVSLTNSTLSGNKVTSGAGGGIDSFGATAILTYVTVAGNTSSAFGDDGVSTSGPTTLKGAIVADRCAGPIISGDYNLDAGNACKLSGSHDQQNINPLLGPLANNGGPTLTHALPAGSPAIDKGGMGATCPATDQRGIARPQGMACDIGAFELEQAATATATATPTATPTTATPTATATSTTTACTPLTPTTAFAAPGFQAQWQQGEALTPNFWGPAGTPGLSEQYADAPGGQRIVQYFDKGRMELTNPATGAVTNGLLANELITGLLQSGDAAFQQRTPAAIPIAGDPDNAGPTYASLSGTAAALLNAAPAQSGILVSTTVGANGTITPGTATAGAGPTALATYDAATQHNVPQAFADYRTTVGLLTIGYAKSEPFLATVKVAGAQRQVMVQVFERRVLTYTADNPDAFKVEMGNIGQHYYKWRYCTT